MKIIEQLKNANGEKTKTSKTSLAKATSHREAGIPSATQTWIHCRKTSTEET